MNSCTLMGFLLLFFLVLQPSTATFRKQTKYGYLGSTEKARGIYTRPKAKYEDNHGVWKCQRCQHEIPVSRANMSKKYRESEWWKCRSCNTNQHMARNCCICDRKNPKFYKSAPRRTWWKCPVCGTYMPKGRQCLICNAKNPEYGENLNKIIQKDNAKTQSTSSYKTETVSKSKRVTNSNIQARGNVQNHWNQSQYCSDKQHLHGTNPPQLDISVEISSNVHYSGTLYDYPGKNYQHPGSKYMHPIPRPKPYTPPVEVGYHSFDGTYHSTNEYYQPDTANHPTLANNDSFSSYGGQSQVMNSQHLDTGNQYVAGGTGNPGLPTMSNQYPRSNSHLEHTSYTNHSPRAPEMQHAEPNLSAYQPSQAAQSEHVHPYGFPCQCVMCIRRFFDDHSYYQEHQSTMRNSQTYWDNAYQSNITEEGDSLPNWELPLINN